MPPMQRTTPVFSAGTFTARQTTSLNHLSCLCFSDFSHICAHYSSATLWFSPHFHKESVIRPSSQFAKVCRMTVLPLKLSCTLTLPRFTSSHAFVSSSIPSHLSTEHLHTDGSHTSKPQYGQQQFHHYLPKMVLPRFTQMLVPLPDHFWYPFSHTSHFQSSVTSVPGDHCSLLASAGTTNT